MSLDGKYTRLLEGYASQWNRKKGKHEVIDYSLYLAPLYPATCWAPRATPRKQTGLWARVSATSLSFFILCFSRAYLNTWDLFSVNIDVVRQCIPLNRESMKLKRQQLPRGVWQVIRTPSPAAVRGTPPPDNLHQLGLMNVSAASVSHTLIRIGSLPPRKCISFQ